MDDKVDTIIISEASGTNESPLATSTSSSSDGSDTDESEQTQFRYTLHELTNAFLEDSDNDSDPGADNDVQAQVDLQLLDLDQTFETLSIFKPKPLQRRLFTPKSTSKLSLESSSTPTLELPTSEMPNIHPSTLQIVAWLFLFAFSSGFMVYTELWAMLLSRF